jgi:hypothetical protein
MIRSLLVSAPSTATDNGLIKRNEKLKAKLASSQKAIENLLGKMEILSIHNNELTTKLENIGSTPRASLVEISEIIKKDVSTSFFDLIDDSNPRNQVLVDNIVVETCSNEVAKENEQLRQEVARLGKALYDKKGKAKQIQPPQDNTTVGVNKPVEGETMICRLCHKEGHKSFQCKAKTGDKQKAKAQAKAKKQNLQQLHRQGGQKVCYTILDQKEKEWKCDSNQGQQASQQRKEGQTNLGAKGNNFNHEKHQESLDPEREVRSPKDIGEFRDLAKLGCISWDA